MIILYLSICRSVYDATVWYYNHLAGQTSFVVLSEDPVVSHMAEKIL